MIVFTIERCCCLGGFKAMDMGICAMNMTIFRFQLFQPSILGQKIIPNAGTWPKAVEQLGCCWSLAEWCRCGALDLCDSNLYGSTDVTAISMGVPLSENYTFLMIVSVSSLSISIWAFSRTQVSIPLIANFLTANWDLRTREIFRGRTPICKNRSFGSPKWKSLASGIWNSWSRPLFFWNAWSLQGVCLLWGPNRGYHLAKIWASCGAPVRSRHRSELCAWIHASVENHCYVVTRV